MASVHYGRLVGTGGFNKTVAIKRLHRALAQTPSFRNMILEEGRLAARIRHPNVVPPLDVLAEGGELLLVMEYVHGESLSRLVRAATAQGERVPLPVGAAILSNVLHGLHAAHEAKDEAGKLLGLVHRDISPQNIIVGADGIARVIDFGIAKAVTSEQDTTAGTIKGKVPYLSPEQLEGNAATQRTDIYAAAVVFWEVLAGRRLFVGDDDSEVLRNIMAMEVKPPSAFNPLVAGTVDDVVLRAISRNPDDRFASAREMALALEGAVHLATATVVGAWTERLAADTLAERAERIREVETTGSLPDTDGDDGDDDDTKVAKGKEKTKGTVRLVAGADGVPPGVGAPPRSQRPPPPLPAAAQRTTTARPPAPAPRPPAPAPASPALASAAPAAIPPPPAKGAPRITIPPATPLRSSSPPVRPPSASKPMIEPRTVIYEPPPLPEPAFVEGVRPISRDEPVPATSPAPLAPPPAGALRKPEIAMRNLAWLPSQEPKAAPASLLKRFFAYLGVFLLLTLIVAWMFAPAIARAWIVTGAASRGIVVTIDRVDVSRKAIRLSDVRAESAEVPGASLRAGTLVIGLRWLVPDQVSLDDAELDFDGSYSTINARLDDFRTKRGATLVEPLAGIRRIEVTSGRIDWKNVAGAGTSALIENITFDVTKNPVRAFGDDYHLDAPLFTMRLAGAPAGPWQLDVDRQGILVRSVLKFDPSGSYPASITRTAGDDGSVSITFAVPPTSLSDLHLPAAVLGGAASDRSRVEAHGELTVVAVQQTTTRAGDASAPRASDAGVAASTDGGADAGPAGAAPPAATMSRSASGRLVLGAGGLSIFPSGPLVDLSLDLPVAGETGRPMAVTGVLAIAQADPTGGATKAAASAAMSGTLDMSGTIARLELSGKSSPIPCAKAAPAAGGGGGGAAAAASKEGPNGIVATIGVTLDDLPGARVSLQPVAICTPKLR
ncbi:MAG: serine/threonine protein kinase [Labilithrix sp.]|nr:serine/threonine protein kinase [Labilithrix sp.]